MLFSASEANTLREQELQNRCTSDLLIYRHGGYNPSTRKKLCLVTPCVSARRDGPYTSITNNHNPSSAVLLHGLSSRFSDGTNSGGCLLTLLEIYGQQNSSSGHDCQWSILLSGWRDTILKNKSPVKSSESWGTIVNPSSLHDISVSAHLSLDKTLLRSRTGLVLSVHCFFYHSP